MLSVTITVFAVTAVDKEVREWASEQQQVGENSQHVRPMFSEKENGKARQKDDQHHAPSRAKPTAAS